MLDFVLASPARLPYFGDVILLKHHVVVYPSAVVRVHPLLGKCKRPLGSQITNFLTKKGVVGELL